MAALELFATLIGGVLRLGIIMWATRWVHMRQETIQPQQHFVFERLNDKYVRDTKALQTAIETPPIGISKNRWKRLLFQNQ